MRDFDADTYLPPCPLCDGDTYATVEDGAYLVRCSSCWYRTFAKDATLESAAESHRFRRLVLGCCDDEGHREHAERRRQERDDACNRNDGRWDTWEPLPKLKPQESYCE